MINQERLVSTFLDLVRIDSPSGSEAEAAEYVANALRELGLEPQIDELHNVTARLEGKGKPLLLSAHLDNVEPGRGIKPVIDGDEIRSDGTTVLGADDLAGVAAILEGLRSLVEDKAKHIPLEIAVSVQEELGLAGAKGLELSQFQAKEAVVLDSGGPVGSITISAPTHNHFDVTIIGKAAHSGGSPEKGIDAIRVAAEAISHMKLGRVDKETTANIGMIRGGTARNAVPERVELVGEARSRNPKKAERQIKAMRQAVEKAARQYGAKVEVHTERAYNNYKFARGDRAVKRAVTAIRKIGRKPTYKESGGGSDANIFNAKKIRAVVVSVGYQDHHTTSEHIPIPELVKAAELVVALAEG